MIGSPRSSSPRQLRRAWQAQTQAAAPGLSPIVVFDLARSQPTGASRTDRWRVRNSVAEMRSFLTLPRAGELGGPTDSRSCSTLMCPAAFWGWLSRPSFPCELRLLFNSPTQPLAECNQAMPVAQPQKNLAGLLVCGGVGIRLVWFLDDLDAAHDATPRKGPDQEAGPGPTGMRVTFPPLCPPQATDGTASFPQHREFYRPWIGVQRAASFMVIEARVIRFSG
jgi:hypothetical protein